MYWTDDDLLDEALDRAQPHPDDDPPVDSGQAMVVDGMVIRQDDGVAFPSPVADGANAQPRTILGWFV